MKRRRAGTPLLLQGGRTMKWQANPKTLEPRSFEIKHDPVVGFYLYVFERGKCIRDPLQDTFEIAVESALEDYDVSEDAWSKVEGLI